MVTRNEKENHEEKKLDKKNQEEENFALLALKNKFLDKKDKRANKLLHRALDSHFITRLVFGFVIAIFLFYVGEFVCSWGGCSFKAPQRVVDYLTSAVTISLGYYLREWSHKGR